jgi:ubiquitin C-terminal hydrolase
LNDSDSDHPENKDSGTDLKDENPGTEPNPLETGTSQPYRYLYRLQAVVLHYGSHDSGHFITYRRLSRNPFDPKANVVDSKSLGQLGSAWQKPKSTDRWFAISDDSVSLVRNVEQEVFEYASQYAYLLFYERVLSSDE